MLSGYIIIVVVGEEVEVEVGKDGLPVDGVPLNNATRADQVLHTQVKKHNVYQIDSIIMIIYFPF